MFYKDVSNAYKVLGLISRLLMKSLKKHIENGSKTSSG